MVRRAGNKVSGCRDGNDDRLISEKEKNKILEGRLDEFTIKCRQAGLKVTPQRLEVFKALVGTEDHPSAEMVCSEVRKAMPNISLDTVNRTLLTLSEIGAAFVVEGTGEVRRFDANLDSHQHFRCIKCRRIIDFYHEPFDDVCVPEEVGKKFEVIRRTVYFEGYCDKCKK